MPGMSCKVPAAMICNKLHESLALAWPRLEHNTSALIASLSGCSYGAVTSNMTRTFGTVITADIDTSTPHYAMQCIAVTEMS